MDVSSFVTSLVTSLLIFIVLMLLFAWLSSMRCNSAVYYPSLILRGLDPWEGRRSWSPLAWIRELWRTSERDVVAVAGVDAAVYLLFLGTAFKILLASAIVLLPVLLPVARTDVNIEDELKDSDPAATNLTFNELDKLTMANVQAKNPRLWAFLFGTYWVTVVTIILLWKAYNHASNLRYSAKTDAGIKPENYAILVRDIPRATNGETVKSRVDSYFRTLYPETFYRSIIITDNKQAEKIWSELETYRKKLARAEAIYAESKTSDNPDGERPMTRTGVLGLIGEEVDTINLCFEKISELQSKLEDEQLSTFRYKQQCAALVFFNSRHATVSASQTLHSRQTDTWTATEAPEPRELLWRNLSKGNHRRLRMQGIVYAVVFLTVVFYMVPITFISAFTTLDNLRRLLPFMKFIVDRPAAKVALEAYLPQITLILFMAVLPSFLVFLSKAEGIPSSSHVVRAASGKYFYFIMFNVFIGVTIAGTLFDSLKIVEKRADQIVPMLGSNLPGNANFFLTFVALKCFVGYGLELCRVPQLILYHLKRKYLCKTEDELKEAWAPGDLGFATRVPNDMLVAMIVLCYSVIAPMIIPFGVLYFGLGWLTMRNQALKVYVPSYESDGRMWPHIHGRMIAALVIYQLTMIGFFGLKKFYYTPLLLPLPVLSIVFAYACRDRFYLAFVYTPLEVACRNATERPNMEAIYAAYIPACLNSDKISWSDSDQYEDCRSYASRTPSV